MAEIPEANERAWNQGAEEVTDGQVDSDAEVKAVGDWYRQKVAEAGGGGETAAVAPSNELVEARAAWDQDQTDAARAEAAIPFVPTGDGIQDAADYGNKTGEWYAKRFVPGLNRQAALEAEEIGEAGRFHLDRFVGAVPELGDAKEMFEYYSDQIA